MLKLVSVTSYKLYHCFPGSWDGTMAGIFHTSDVNTSDASFCHRLNTVRTVTTTIPIVTIVKNTSKYLVAFVFFGSSHFNML